MEADHVELFDRGRGTALHLFEHVHGDSRERGPALIDLMAPLPETTQEAPAKQKRVKVKKVPKTVRGAARETKASRTKKGKE